MHSGGKKHEFIFVFCVCFVFGCVLFHRWGMDGDDFTPAVLILSVMVKMKSPETDTKIKCNGENITPSTPCGVPAHDSNSHKMHLDAWLSVSLMCGLLPLSSFPSCYGSTAIIIEPPIGGLCIYRL